ncbi:hypothetical protein G5C51_04425 [Streptomyces sp. A7024]|uniref:Uncharacterized protein n=1 Tax=Streptomyces coryli TaxID=1128680 RepID=A0A6G4TTL6_9ACTN|nr:hypothetical protein [Streptomyces coryli]NGN63153.1 hypothetical protein [Streptomyces coryli]
MTFNARTRTFARALRGFLTLVDRLHPVALLVLVPVLIGVVYAAAPFLVALLTAVVAVLKASAFLAGAGLLARLAIRTAAAYRRPLPAGSSPALSS